MIIDNHNNRSENCSDKSNRRYHDYIDALEEERRKVQVFERELPLCLELVTQAIETWKRRLRSEQNNLSGCSEQTSSPVLEEFIPIHRANSSHSVHEEQEPGDNKVCDHEGDDTDCCNDTDTNPEKSEWLRSVQLWNQTPDPPLKKDSPRKASVLELKSNGSGGAFHPFKKGKIVGGGDAAAAPPSTSSTADTGGGSKKEEKEGQSQRKARRCWSPELHKRFLRALQQLGGSHVATPKQIRDLMKVDGLTNDEVKSHLQKYRLHTRRPSSSSHNNNNNNNTQTHQFVVVGGIWVPPEYTAAAATTTKSEVAGGTAAASIYAPVATLPPPFRETSPSPKQRQSKSPSHHDSGDIEGGDQSYSPASSSSTHKTNAC